MEATRRVGRRSLHAPAPTWTGSRRGAPPRAALGALSPDRRIAPGPVRHEPASGGTSVAARREGSAAIPWAAAPGTPGAVGPIAAPSAVDRFLREARVLWLSTVHADGRPHLVPIWFTWDGSAFLLFSKPGARKIEDIRRNPDVMLAVGDPHRDFDVQLIEGRAELLPAATTDVMPPGHLDRYEAELAAAGLDRRGYAELYSQAVRIVPTRFLPWHGRAPIAHVAEANRHGATTPAA